MTIILSLLSVVFWVLVGILGAVFLASFVNFIVGVWHFFSYMIAYGQLSDAVRKKSPSDHEKFFSHQVKKPTLIFTKDAIAHFLESSMHENDAHISQLKQQARACRQSLVNVLRLHLKLLLLLGSIIVFLMFLAIFSSVIFTR